MAWVAGNDVTTGDLITAAQWNNYLGVTGSLEYLKTETDKLDDVSHSEPGNAKDTIYQNTSGKFRLVTVSISITSGVAAQAIAYIGAATPPTTVVVNSYYDGTASIYLTFSFIVPNNYYYKVTEAAGTITILEWHEWDFH